MKRIIYVMAAMLIAAPAYAAPNGSYKLEIKTKTPWPIAVTVSGDQMNLKSRGRTKVIGATQTNSASATKITGSANFSTNSCNANSVVTVTLKFSKDGSFKSGSAKGKCARDSGGSRNFSGKVVLD